MSFCRPSGLPSHHCDFPFVIRRTHHDHEHSSFDEAIARSNRNLTNFYVALADFYVRYAWLRVGTLVLVEVRSANPNLLLMTS